MNEKELRRKIYHIVKEETWADGKISQPTKKDLKRRPHCHPGFHHAVFGQLKAASSIVRMLNEENLINK